MPRQAKVIVPGFPHHIVVQRGHNRQPVFVERRDFEYYLANLQEWKQVYELEVFSYCLMTNHVHLVVQANDNVTAIPQLMKRLAGRQTRFVNAPEKRSGSLWEGRYKISPINTDAYLLACCRYVELNPVKAGMVDAPDTFRALVGSHQGRLEAYRRFVGQENGSPADELIRAAISSNKLTGGNKFVDEIENLIGIRVETRKPGRPATENRSVPVFRNAFLSWLVIYFAFCAAFNFVIFKSTGI